MHEYAIDSIEQMFYKNRMKIDTRSEAFRAGLKHLLARGGMSQTELSIAADVDKTYISKILNGSQPGSEQAKEKISRALRYKNSDEVVSLGRHILEGKSPDNFEPLMPHTEIAPRETCKESTLMSGKYAPGCERILKTDIGRELLEDLFYLAEHDMRRFHIIASKVLEEADKSRQQAEEEKKPLPKGGERKHTG